MATRFKYVEECVDYTDPRWASQMRSCRDVPYPIQEWQLLPAVQDATYTIGGAAPENKSVNVLFPELNEWLDRKYNSFRYKVRIEYQNTQVEWLNVFGNQLNNRVFTPDNLLQSKVDLQFINLGDLTPGTYNAVLHFEAFGLDNSNVEHYQEAVPFNVKLTVVQGNSVAVPTDKEIYNVRYNKSTRLFSGDTTVTVYKSGASFKKPTPFELKPIVNTLSDKTTFAFDGEQYQDNMLIAPLYAYAIGNYSGSFIISADNVDKSVTFNLQVVDDANDFSVTPDGFDFVVQKNPGEIKESTVIISKPEALNISIQTFPSFIENVQLAGNQLTFSTKNSQDLQLGNYSGAIVLSSGSVTKNIQINLLNVQGIDSDFRGKPFYFALDKNKISLQKTNARAIYAVMELDMYIKGFGREFREKQYYEYQYFEDKIEIYPGEEIQDFFNRIKENSPDDIGAWNYNLTIASIRITEHDDNDTEISDRRLNRLFFAPGKTPKCFPLFSDFPVRSTVSNSLISLYSCNVNNTNLLDDIFEKYTENPNVVSSRETVYPQLLHRNLFKEEWRNRIVDCKNVKFIPLPEIENPVHLFFETQNFVMEWFTVAEKYKTETEFEHLYNDAEIRGLKQGAERKDTLILNTGWILEEEIELVNQLLESRICFGFINGKKMKLEPISKKNEMQDSEENIYSMDLEFKILEDER